MNFSLYTSVLAAFSISFIAQAQDLNGRVGTGSNEYRYGTPMQLLEASSEGAYGCLSKSSDATILHYSPEGNFDWKKKVEAPTVMIDQKKIKSEIVAVKQMQDKWYLLARTADGRTNESRLYAFSLNKQGLTGAEPTLIDKYQGSRYKDLSFKLRLAADSAALLSIRTGYVKDNDPEAYTLTLVGPDMTQIWQREVKYKKPNKLVLFQDATVDRSHHAYLLTTIDWKKEAVSRHDRYGSSFLVVGPESEQPRELTADMNLKVKNMEASVSPAGELRVMGTYTDELEDKDALMKGVFFLKARPDASSFEITALAPFPADLAQEFKKDNEMNFFSVDAIHHRADGSAVAVLGRSYVLYVEMGKSTMTQYHEGPILVMNFDKEGRHAWSQVIRRKQMQSSTDWVGQTSFLHGNKLYIMYNDDPRNMNPKGDKTYSWEPNAFSFKGAPRIVAINEKGEVQSYFPLGTEKRPDFMMATSQVLKAGNKLWCSGLTGSTYTVLHFDLP